MGTPINLSDLSKIFEFFSILQEAGFRLDDDLPRLLEDPEKMRELTGKIFELTQYSKISRSSQFTLKIGKWLSGNLGLFGDTKNFGSAVVRKEEIEKILQGSELNAAEKHQYEGLIFKITQDVDVRYIRSFIERLERLEKITIKYLGLKGLVLASGFYVNSELPIVSFSEDQNTYFELLKVDSAFRIIRKDINSRSIIKKDCNIIVFY